MSQVNGSIPIFFQEKLKTEFTPAILKMIFLFIQNKVHAREVCERTFDRSALIQMILSNYA